jgi:hypothetical protein
LLFLKILQLWAIFPQNIHLHKLQPALFFSVTQWRKFITEKTGQGGGLNIYQIHFALKLPT